MRVWLLKLTGMDISEWSERGENGFGYNPLFLVGETGKTAAEFSLEEKNQISHRAQAFEKLVEAFPLWAGASKTILVMSDSRGDRQIVEEIKNRYFGKVAAIFHNGDSELDSQDSIWDGVYVVNGNCDYFGGLPRPIGYQFGRCDHCTDSWSSLWH